MQENKMLREVERKYKQVGCVLSAVALSRVSCLLFQSSWLARKLAVRTIKTLRRISEVCFVYIIYRKPSTYVPQYPIRVRLGGAYH